MKQFIKTQYKQYKDTRNINIKQAYLQFAQIKLKYSKPLQQELEKFVESTTDEETDVLQGFILKFEKFITPWKLQYLLDKCRQAINVEQAGNLDLEQSDWGSELKEMEQIIPIQAEVNDGTYFQISELRKNMNDIDKFVIVKVYRKPENAGLHSITDYFIGAKDNSGLIQLVFIKQRLQESFEDFYNLLQLQNTYRIQNFDVGFYNNKIEIKIKKHTQIILIKEAEPEYIVNRLIEQDIKQDEELNLVGLIQKIDPLNLGAKFRQGVLLTGKPCSKEPLVTPFTLWDQHIQTELNVGEIIVMEFALLKRMGDRFEIKSTKNKMRIIKKDILAYKQYLKGWNYVEQYRKFWLQSQQMVQEIAEDLSGCSPFVDIQGLKMPYNERLSAVLKVVSSQSLPRFCTKVQKLIRDISVEYNTAFAPINMTLYGPICNNSYLESNNIILAFEDIGIKQYNGINELVTYDGQTKIKLPQEYEGHSQWQLIKGQMELLSQVQVKKEDSFDIGNSSNKKRTIRIKVKYNSGLMNQAVYPYCTLDKVSQETLDRFHVMALVSDVHPPVKIQTRYGEQLRRDIYLWDEYNENVPLTLWNKQAFQEIRTGSVLVFESLCYDRKFNELKTVLNETQIIDNLQNLPQEQQNRASEMIRLFQGRKSLMNEYPWKHLIEVLNQTFEKIDQNEYYYVRGAVVEIFLGKIQPRCPQCFNQTLILEEQGYACMNGERRHLVEFPKFQCFTRARLADGTCNLEAILGDDVLEEFLNQKKLKEAFLDNRALRSEFDSILYKDMVFKLQILKPKQRNSDQFQEEEQRRVKIQRLQFSQASQENLRMLQEYIK